MALTPDGQEQKNTAKRGGGLPLTAKGNFLAVLTALAAILLGAFSLRFFVAAPLIAAVCFLVGTVSSAMLFCYGAGAVRLIPMLGAVCAYFLSGIPGACLALAVISAGIVLTASAAHGRTRFETAAWQTFAVCGVLFALVLCLVAAATGSLGAEAFRSAVDTLVETVVPYYQQIVAEVAENAQTDAQRELLSVLSDPERIGTAIRSILNVLPAYAAALISCFCYGTVSLFSRLAERTGRRLPLLRMFSVPVVTAYLYVFAVFIGIFTSTSSVFGLALRYLSILLTPCLALLGARAVIALFRSKATGGARVVVILIAVFCCTVMLPYVLSLLAFIGAGVCTRAAVAARLHK